MPTSTMEKRGESVSAHVNHEKFEKLRIKSGSRGTRKRMPPHGAHNCAVAALTHSFEQAGPPALVADPIVTHILFSCNAC